MGDSVGGAAIIPNARRNHKRRWTICRIKIEPVRPVRDLALEEAEDNAHPVVPDKVKAQDAAKDVDKVPDKVPGKVLDVKNNI